MILIKRKQGPEGPREEKGKNFGKLTYLAQKSKGGQKRERLEARERRGGSLGLSLGQRGGERFRVFEKTGWDESGRRDTNTNIACKREKRKAQVAKSSSILLLHTGLEN